VFLKKLEGECVMFKETSGEVSVIFSITKFVQYIKHLYCVLLSSTYLLQIKRTLTFARDQNKMKKA
jgi:hypothetical protein